MRVLRFFKFFFQQNNAGSQGMPTPQCRRCVGPYGTAWHCRSFNPVRHFQPAVVKWAQKGKRCTKRPELPFDGPKKITNNAKRSGLRARSPTQRHTQCHAVPELQGGHPRGLERAVANSNPSKLAAQVTRRGHEDRHRRPWVGGVCDENGILVHFRQTNKFSETEEPTPYTTRHSAVRH